MRVASFIVFLLFLYSCTPTTYNRASLDDRPPSAPGKCYAKVIIPDQIEKTEEEKFIYTGDNFEQVGVQKEIIPGRAGGTKWVKKKADKNCLSSNPEDCLVWCLQETPGTPDQEFYVVVDTNQIKDFVVEMKVREVMLEPGGFTEWREVVCETQISKSFISDIQQSLVDRGYLESIPISGEMDKFTKAALIKFQKANSLPYGQLDMESLEALGVSY